MQVSDGVKRWIEIASVEALKDKLAEYTPDRADLSPRDVEARSRLAGAIKCELAKREVVE